MSDKIDPDFAENLGYLIGTGTAPAKIAKVLDVRDYPVFEVDDPHDPIPEKEEKR